MTTDKQYKYPRDVDPHDYETALIFIADLERQLAAANEKVRELKNLLVGVDAQHDINCRWHHSQQPCSCDIQERQAAIDAACKEKA